MKAPVAEQMTKAIIDASAPNAPPVSITGPFVVPRNNPTDVPPETATLKIPP